MVNFRKTYELIFRPEGVFGFIHKLGAKHKRILDVGCGNDSAFQYKRAFSDIYYMGLDVGEYNNDHQGYEDEKVIVKSSEFASAIKNFQNVNAIISRHNLEHCDQPKDVLISICRVLEKNGSLFLAFPNPESINFPSRSKTLNYYDDDTHNETPPNPNDVIKILEDNGMEITFFAPRYQPLILRCIGFIQDPLSWYFKKVYQGTWAFYGFECVIWARKIQ